MTRILLVDDAADTRQFLVESILRPEGYEVQVAEDGQAALELIQQFPPDLIISDNMMPRLSGLGLLAALRAEGDLTPFILMTAEGSESLAVQALRLGASDYLIKPFEIDALLAAILRALGGPNRAAILLYQAVDPIIAVDNQHRLTYFNAAASTVLRLQPDTIGQPFLEAINQPSLLAIFEDDTLEERHYEIQTEDSRFWSLQVSLLKESGALLMMHDISPLKELERAKADFVTTISHDLRSPLTTILGYVELIQRVGPLNEQQTRFSENILFSVRSITSLLTDLLELSKIEAGRDTVLEPVRMDAIIRYALETLRSEKEQQQHQIDLQLAPHSTALWGNAIRLKQLVVNLVQNAIKYTPQGGKIDIALYEDGDFTVLQVKDNGIGIPADDHNDIFHKFFRSKNVADKYPGTGLGLSIVRSIVDAHGGRIWLESTLNQGTTFIVMLPTHPTHVA